jgi:outer membrane protein assembly factor BamB
MSPLFKSGRIFVPADNKVIAVDAYNGTPLWDLDVPQSRRLGALKDCGQMVVTQDELYVAAQDECWRINVISGEVIGKHKAPQLVQGERREWGYIASVGDQLFGSGKKQGASFYELARLNCDQLEGDFREMICSDYLFAMDRHTGQKGWTYQSGVIFNNTITIGGDYLYLIESRNDKAQSDLDGRMRVDYFCEGDNYIVKVNRFTGEKIWEKSFHFPFSQIMYLSYTPDQLLVVGSYNVGSHVHYGLYAFRTQDGEKKWENSYKGDGIGGEHGEQWQHPVIIGNTIYQRPYSFDLQTGRQGSYVLHRGGGGCGGLSGSAKYLFGRGSNPRMYELTQGETSGTPLTRVNRPGCWINIVAAGGLIMIPESSSGCTCDYPVQSSFVFVPGS